MLKGDDVQNFYRIYSTISTEHHLLGVHMQTVGPENFALGYLEDVLQKLHDANMLIVEHKRL